VAVDLQANAAPIGRIDYDDGFYIETLIDCRLGEPMYRSCTPSGAMCRYSSDLWQAELYLQHLRAG
jgi:hypothetical protein